MNIEFVDLVGYFAALITTFSFVPQAWQVIKTKHTKDLSLGMYSMFSLGIFLWLIYGILLNRPPIIFANSVTLCFALVILGMKIRYK